MKIFTKEIKIALAAICAVALLIYGINFLKGINLFQKNKLYYVAFHDISGLAESNPVYANGYRIGIVRTIHYDYDHPGNVYIGVDVEENMHIPEGSRAELVSQMLGGVTMNIILGNSPRSLQPGDTIYGGPAMGALDQMGEMMPQVQAMMPKLDSILTNINTILSNPAIQQTLVNAATLTDQLKTTTQTLNTLMQGDVSAMAHNLKPATENLRDITAKLNDINYGETVNKINQSLNELQTLTGNINQTVLTTANNINNPNSSLGLLMNDRSLYDNLNKTLLSSDSLLIDLRQHPKRYVHFSVFGRKDK